MELYGRTWEVVEDWQLDPECDWLVITTEFGELYMNNLDGVMHFVTHKGVVLKTYV